MSSRRLAPLRVWIAPITYTEYSADKISQFTPRLGIGEIQPEWLREDDEAIAWKCGDRVLSGTPAPRTLGKWRQNANNRREHPGLWAALISWARVWVYLPCVGSYNSRDGRRRTWPVVSASTPAVLSLGGNWPPPMNDKSYSSPLLQEYWRSWSWEGEEEEGGSRSALMRAHVGS